MSGAHSAEQKGAPLRSGTERNACREVSQFPLASLPGSSQCLGQPHRQAVGWTSPHICLATHQARRKQREPSRTSPYSRGARLTRSPTVSRSSRTFSSRSKFLSVRVSTISSAPKAASTCRHTPHHTPTWSSTHCSKQLKNPFIPPWDHSAKLWDMADKSVSPSWGEGLPDSA